jgi:hypothetical protein
LSIIAAAISVALPSVIAIVVALTVGHCRLRHRQPSQLPSPLAITVAVAIGHCQELLPWQGKNLFRQSKHFLFGQWAAH